MTATRHTLPAARFPWPGALISLTFAAGCVFPTDRSDDLSVVILNETTDVVAGDTLRLAAELRHAGGEVVPSATIDFRSDDATVGIVDSTGTFRAIAAGNATIIARALEFEGAVPDSATLTVLATLDIIDVRPRTVRFGEVISIAGFGLDPSRITGVTIGGVSAPIEGFTRVNPTDPTSFDTLRVWVPAPAAALSDVVIRRGGDVLLAIPVRLRLMLWYSLVLERGIASPSLSSRKSNPG